jgi:hypothetical protein
MTFGSVRFGTVRFGSVRSGSVRSSPDRFGPVRSGSVRSGPDRSVRFGSVRFGPVRSGSIGSVRFGPDRSVRFGFKNSMQASLRRVIHFLNFLEVVVLLALVSESTRVPCALLWAPAPRLRSSQCASDSQQRVKTHL